MCAVPYTTWLASTLITGALARALVTPSTHRSTSGTMDCPVCPNVLSYVPLSGEGAAGQSATRGVDAPAMATHGRVVASQSSARDT
jgi:hypothetical protein